MPVQKREVPVWDKPDPTKTEDPLSKKKKASAKARAKAAGRPYPNLIDNMAAAKSVKKDDQASLNISGKLHRIYREKNGDVVVNHAGTRKQNGSYDKINLTNVAGVKSVKGGVKSTTNWHKNNPHTDVKKYDSPAWTRSEGKNPSGGLNAKGRASAKAEGHNLKPPVKSGDNPRRASFLARMGNMPGPEYKPNGEPTRLLLSLNAWGASSKADAKKKAASISRVEKSMVAPNVYKPASSLTKKERKKVLRGIKSHKNYSPSKPDNSKFLDEYKKDIAMTNSAGLSRLRKPDLEGPDFVKLRRNVYTRPDSGVKNRDVRGLPKMRRPTVITQGDLPKGMVAGATAVGSKSAPRVISTNAKLDEKIERIIPKRYVMAHEGAHANTKRSAYRTYKLTEGRKGFKPTTRSTQLEEARADDVATRQTRIKPLLSYETMSQIRPVKYRHYRQQRAQLKELNENKVNKGIKRIPGQLEIPGMGEVVQQAAKRRLPTEGRWKHLSGKTSRVRIVGPSSSAKDSFDVIDSKDIKRILSRDQIAFIKPKNVSKSMEYSVSMNQSRFGGSGAVGRNMEDVEKGVRLDKFAETKAGKRYLKYDAHVLPKRPKRDEKGIPYLEIKYNATKKAKQDAAALAATGALGTGVAVIKADKAHYADRLLREVGNLAAQINTKAPEQAYKKGVRTGMRHNAKVLVPLGAVGGSAATATGMTVYGRRKREPMPVVVVKAEQMYDQMGNPVPAKKPIMSGDAKLGAAGAAVGVVGANRMAFARTLPDKLKGQADAAAQKVAFQERLATDQIARVQAASQIPNRFTRRKQVNMHQFYSDKAQGSLSTARSKQAMANNALAAAPNKKRAHLKSGGALVATGATMGGLAAYNNSKKRKQMGKVK